MYSYRLIVVFRSIQPIKLDVIVIAHRRCYMIVFIVIVLPTWYIGILQGYQVNPKGINKLVQCYLKMT